MLRSSLRFLFVLGLIIAAPAADAQSDDIGHYLTWQRDPTTTMTVNWVNLYEDATARVWYRARGTAEEWRSQDGEHKTLRPSVLQVRRAELTGLQPGTAYDFAWGERPPETATHWFRTMPAEAGDRPVHFVAGGDMLHRATWLDAMNARAGALDPDFAVLGGDLAYADGRRATNWVTWLRSWADHARSPDGRSIPMVVAIGNHEVRGGYHGRVPEDAPYFHGLFALPQQRAYYALDFGDYLSFLILDSEHTTPIEGAQTEWLQQALQERTSQHFLFPVYHWPIYGTDKAPSGRLPSEHERSIRMRQHWAPLFERHGVSAVFENDHHNYKRTHPIRAHERDDETGIIYLGDGAWGVNTRTVPAPGAAWYLAHAEPRRHLFHVTLHPTGVINVEAIDAQGVRFDGIRLHRARTPPVDAPTVGR
jgi:acid phosphatase type 7